LACLAGFAQPPAQAGVCLGVVCSSLFVEAHEQAVLLQELPRLKVSKVRLSNRWAMDTFRPGRNLGIDAASTDLTKSRQLYLNSWVRSLIWPDGITSYGVQYFSTFSCAVG
jgi:hypothetical protein